MLRFRALLPLLLLVPSSGHALEVSFDPPQPRQGDTVSVFVSGSAAAPSVVAGGRSLPAFPLGDGYRAFVPLSPLDRAGPLKIRVETNGQTATITVPVARRVFGVQRLNLPKTVKTEADPIELARVGAVKALQSPAKRWEGLFLAPAGGRVSSPYGVRRIRNGRLLTDYYHRGLDYAPGEGAPALSPARGRVVLVGNVGEGFRVNGNTVGIDHGQGVVSLLLHLSKIGVKEGDEVRGGDVVGRVGATGEATGPHLHWGFYVEGVAVDPEPWMRKAVK
jgi:murein DD-endopeptidase MepM/ murein hydrolase activator NlpD